MKKNKDIINQIDNWAEKKHNATFLELCTRTFINTLENSSKGDCDLLQLIVPNSMKSLYEIYKDCGGLDKKNEEAINKYMDSLKKSDKE